MIGAAPFLMAALGPGSSSAILKRTLELGAYATLRSFETPFDNSPRAYRTASLWLPAIHGRGAQDEKNPGREKIKIEKGFRFPGILKFLERNFERVRIGHLREWMTQYMSATLCSVCHGKRLRPESLAVKLAGSSIADFTALSLSLGASCVDKILKQLT